MNLKIFSLMFGASIILMNPVFSMDDDQDSQSLTLRTFPITKTEKQDGLGTLATIHAPVLISVLEHLPVTDGLKCFRLSKATYNLFNNERAWGIFANHHGCPLDPQSPLIARTSLKEFLSFCMDPKKTYKITIADLQSLKATPYPDPQHEVSYVFSRGKNRFQLTNGQVGPDRLEVLEQDASVTFSWNQSWNQDNSGFTALITVGKSSAGVKDIESSHYKSLMNTDFLSPQDYYAGNCFVIKKIN